MDKLTRAQAVAIVGEDLVRQAEEDNCRPTDRLITDGTVEYVGDASTDDGTTVEAYYYPLADDIRETEDLGDIDWQIDHYRVYE